MSLNDSHIRRMIGTKTTARRMRRYPEGNARSWAIIEAAFAAWCVAAVAICVTMIFH